MRMIPSLTFGDAQIIAGGCVDAAARQSASVSVAVTDEAGNLLHLCRMDGAKAHTVERASQKARIAATVGVPTGVIEDVYRQNPVTAQPGFAGRGGLPVSHEGQCAGGIGISGSSPEMDEAIAKAGLTKFQDVRRPTAT